MSKLSLLDKIWWSWILFWLGGSIIALMIEPIAYRGMPAGHIQFYQAVGCFGDVSGEMGPLFLPYLLITFVLTFTLAGKYRGQ